MADARVFKEWLKHCFLWGEVVEDYETFDNHWRVVRGGDGDVVLWWARRNEDGYYEEGQENRLGNRLPYGVLEMSERALRVNVPAGVHDMFFAAVEECAVETRREDGIIYMVVEAGPRKRRKGITWGEYVVEKFGMVG